MKMKTFRGRCLLVAIPMLAIVGCDLLSPERPEWEPMLVAAAESLDELGEHFDYTQYCFPDGMDWCSLVVPDTVDAGVPFEVRVDTAPRTCPPVHSRVDVTLTDASAELTGWEKLDEDRNCPLDIVWATHHVDLVFPSPGEYPVRLHGRAVVGTGWAPYNLQTTVTVR